MCTYKGTLGKISTRSDHEVDWTIENITSLFPQEKNISYNSPKFTVSSEQWHLCNRMFCNNTGCISLVLLRISGTVSPVTASFNFGLKKVDGKIEPVGPEITWVFEREEVFVHYVQLQISELQRRKTELLPSDTLTLTCTLKTWKHVEPFSGLDTLSRNFSDMFIAKRRCDVILRVKDEEFPVHTFVLSARSSVFASMFEIDMKEKRTGIVDIEDCDPETFREFLLYLYSGKLEKSSSNAFELYKIADKYDVGDLKQHCLVSVLLNISVENVLDTFIFIHLFSNHAKFIPMKVQKFFSDNFREIIETEKWAKFLKESPTLANMLLRGMAKTKYKK